MKRKSTHLIFTVPAFIIIFFISKVFPAAGSENLGENLYQEYCASCHGISGKGNGELSYLLYPKPRDLTSGLFKIRSTPAGNPPMDNDLITSIKNGMPGTAMPSFNFLNHDEFQAIVSYVKDLGNINNGNTVQILIPDEIPQTDKLLKLGKLIYTDIGCNKCHGEKGRGDGPSSNVLVDSWGYPIIPRDFTSGVYLGGGQAQDLYLRFVGGMDGTPMPAYGNLSELLGKPKENENELAWALVHYVKSLEVKNVGKSIKSKENGKLIATEISRSMQPEELLDGHGSLWEDMEPYSIPISRLWQKDKVNYQMVNVQAVYNSNYIAIKMEWEDYSKDMGLYRIQDFQDGAAIQFSIDGTKGFHGMGSQEHPTDIWFWKAEWQLRSNEKTNSDIVYAYANRVSDSDVDTYPAFMNDVAYLSGRDAGNINSEAGKTSPVENVTAIGPQTVTPLPENAQKVMGSGFWDGESWKVVFVRKFKSDTKRKVDFNKSESIPLAFAVWNGSENDRNGQKMVSTWYELELKD